MGIEVSFMEHVLPQLISLLVAGIIFYRSFMFYTKSAVNNYTIGNMAFAVLLLIYGKISIFLNAVNPDLIKYHVDASLMVYFAIMPLILARLSRIPRKYHIWLQIFIIPFLAMFLDGNVIQGDIIFFADLYLVFLAVFMKFKSKYWFMAAFVILGLINLLTGYFHEFWRYYAWVETVGQILFLKGFCKLIEEVKH